jgi:hypothetical protein
MRLSIPEWAVPCQGFCEGSNGALDERDWRLLFP